MTHTLHTTHRLITLSLGALLLLQPLVAIAADSATFELMPACAVEKKTGTPDGNVFGGALPDVDTLIKAGDGISTGTCDSFTVVDPATLKSKALKQDDTIDIAIVIKNPTKVPVIHAKAWLAYDPLVLSASTITVDDAFPTLAPGENTVSATEGQVKVNATAKDPIKEEEIVLARVRFTVLGGSDKTVISVHDAGSDAPKHSVIFQKTASGTGEEPVAIATPASLVIPLPAAATAPAAVSAASVAATAVSSATPEPAPAPVTAPAPPIPAAENNALRPSAEGTLPPEPVAAAPAVPASPAIFPNLRIQNLRVTTQGGSAYLGWDALLSTDLVSYNIYYGATSGQYLQRKTIDKSEVTLTIRGLPEGTPYFFAVRGLSASGLETEFSQEVSVTIGKAQTSTSPLDAKLIGGPDGKAPKTDGTVSGESGTGTSMALIGIICSAVGTLLASRRQLIAVSSIDHVS